MEESGFTIQSNLDYMRVLCPRCHHLLGLKFKETEPKIEKVKFTVGDKVYPTLDVNKIGKLPIICQCCGYKIAFNKFKRMMKAKQFTLFL